MMTSLLPFLNNFAADACHPRDFLGFPTWYQYLKMTQDSSGACTPMLSGINDIWLIVAAVIEILLRLAALAAIGFVIYGGIQYISSQGNPDQTAKARGTIINALIGLTIAVAAAAVVTFIAGRFQG